MFDPQFQPYGKVPSTAPSGGGRGRARAAAPGGAGGMLCGLDGSLQEGSFILSMIFQAVTLVVSAIALVQGGMPPVLNTIVWLELIVQLVELTWYSYIAYRYVWMGVNVPISYRYFDWMITTPIMMTSIFLFVLWDADKECDNVLGETSRVIALIIVVAMDLLMLLVGYAYEAKDSSMTQALRAFFDMLACNLRENIGLWLGWIPFLGVFAPLFVIVAQPKTNTGWGVTSVLLTFSAWALYGVVALLGSEGVWMDETRNTAYNVLDIFSKNAVGLIVSSVAIGNTFNTTAPSNCTTY